MPEEKKLLILGTYADFQVTNYILGELVSTDESKKTVKMKNIVRMFELVVPHPQNPQTQALMMQMRPDVFFSTDKVVELEYGNALKRELDPEFPGDAQQIQKYESELARYKMQKSNLVMAPADALKGNKGILQENRR
jgi:hypothetical protein